MSRRITFAALAASTALIASGTLIATYAAADRECFEDSCRAQEAVEAQAAQQPVPPQAQAQAIEESVAPASATNVSTIPDTVAPEPVAAAANAKAEAKREPVTAAKPEPVTPAPMVVAKPEPKVEPKVEPSLVPSAATRLQPYTPRPVVMKSEPDVVLPRVVSQPAPQPLPRYEQAPPRRDAPRTRIPQYAERPQPPAAQPAPVRPARTVPAAAATVERAPIAVQPHPALTYADRAGGPAAVPAYVAPARPAAIDVPRQAPSTASAAVIEVPGEIQTGDGLVTVYPNLRPDPAWKLCQIDSRDLGRRAYRCTAYSYHPYGEGGYRPYGTYRSYPSAPGYVMAPNAKIISIEPND